MTPLMRETLFWVSVATCAAAEAAILLSAFRARPARPRKSVAFFEAVWALLPAFALAWVLFATWGEIRRATGHQRMTMPMAAHE